MAHRPFKSNDTQRMRFIKDWLSRNRALWPRIAGGMEYKKIIDKAFDDGIWSPKTNRTTVRNMIEKLLLENKIDDQVTDRRVSGSAANNHGHE